MRENIAFSLLGSIWPRATSTCRPISIVKPTIEFGFDYKKLAWSGKVSDKDILRAREIVDDEKG